MYSPSVIFVTGGCGFIGSNFINYFRRKHPSVKIVNYDRVDYCANPANIDLQGENYTLVVGDLNDKEKLLATLKIHAVDTIVHFAAQTHVDNSFGNSIQFTKDNVLGTHTLLECAHVYGDIKRFVHISTDEVYGEVDLEHPGCNEKNLLNPTNPYAATKAGAEFLVRSYYYSFQLPVIITRGNNVYGPYQYPEKLIPKFIKSLLADEKCTIHGKGDTRRNFIHAYDVARAVDTIMRKGHINRIYNIGTQNEYTVLDIAEKLVKRIKPGTTVPDNIVFIEDRKFNDFRYAIDSNALRALGWSEEITFDVGLEETIQWYERKWRGQSKAISSD